MPANMVFASLIQQEDPMVILKKDGTGLIPCMRQLTSYARTHLKNEMIDGFLGRRVSPMIDIVKHYVLGINEACNSTD